MHHHTSSQQTGFTLIELMVSVAIIGLFALLVIPSAELLMQRSQESDLRRALRELRVAIDAYKQAADEGRIQVSSGESGYPKHLRVLVEGVEDARNPNHEKIYFLRQLPRDPLADDSIDAEESWATRSYRSPPDRPRPGADVFDVHSKSEAIGLNGIPYREW